MVRALTVTVAVDSAQRAFQSRVGTVPRSYWTFAKCSLLPVRAQSQWPGERFHESAALICEQASAEKSASVHGRQCHTERRKGAQRQYDRHALVSPF